MSEIQVGRTGLSPDLAEAWELLETKRDEQGRYVVDWVPPRCYFKPDKGGEPSRWVTLYAYLALKRRDKPATYRL